LRVCDRESAWVKVGPLSFDELVQEGIRELEKNNKELKPIRKEEI
jgi:hypothetical protein